jgi:hypothetical protein
VVLSFHLSQHVEIVAVAALIAAVTTLLVCLSLEWQFIAGLTLGATDG